MRRDARDRDGGLHADKDQKRRHQKSAADTEHSGYEADCQPHRQHEKDIDRYVGDRKEYLHGSAAGVCLAAEPFYSREAARHTLQRPRRAQI